MDQNSHLMHVVLRPHGRKHVTSTHCVAFNEANGISMDTQILLLSASCKMRKHLPFTIKYRRDLASKGIWENRVGGWGGEELPHYPSLVHRLKSINSSVYSNHPVEEKP